MAAISTSRSGSSGERPTLSQSELAYRDIKEAILTGRIAPRARLVETQLASELGVSRTPIREALRRLVSEGFVSRHHDGGLIVHEPSAREIDDIYQIREMLDGLAARLAAQRIVDSEMTRIELALQALKEATDASASDAGDEAVGHMVVANITFHEILHQASGNERLKRLSRDMSDSVRLISREAFATRERAQAIVAEHEAVVAALRERDPDAAERAAREHLRNARQYLNSRPIALEGRSY